MKIQITQKTLHPNGKDWLMPGDELEVHNPLGRKYVRAGKAEVIPRVAEDWVILASLEEQKLDRKKGKKKEEKGGE